MENAIGGRTAVTLRHQAQAGNAGLMDVLLGLLVAAMALPTVLLVVNQQTQEVHDQVAAQQLKAVTEATSAYVKDNFATLYNAMGTGVGDFITIPQLSLAGYLPSSFATTNAYRQTLGVLLRRIEPTGSICSNQAICKQLVEAVVVSTGGTVLDRGHAAHIATLAGAHGGLITDQGTAHGVYGTWCIDFTRFGGGAATNCAVTDPPGWISVSDALSGGRFPNPPPSQGGLAAAMFFNGAEMISEYLNRFDTGNPEDNTMHTAIDMGDQAINNASVVQIAGVTQTTSGGQPQGLDAPRMNMINDLYGGNYTANAGNLTVATLTAGTSVVAPAFLHSSDQRLKANIRDIDDPVRLVDRLKGHRFQWKGDGSDDLGLVAQEVQAVLPEAVRPGRNGYLAVKYDILVAPLIEAVKQLSARVDRLEGRPRRTVEAPRP